MVISFLLYADGSPVFRLPIPEDFAWHCMFSALNKDLKLRMLKSSAPCGAFSFVSYEEAKEKASAGTLTFTKTVQLKDTEKDFKNTLQYEYYNSIRK